MSVSEIYQQELKARSFHSDPAQLQAVAALDDCAKAWAGYKRKRANAIKKQMQDSREWVFNQPMFQCADSIGH